MEKFVIGKYVSNAVKQRLTLLGFKKKGEIYAKDITSNVFCSISTGGSTRKGFYYLTLYIGIGYRDVNNLYDNLCGFDKHSLSPTIWQPIWTLMDDQAYLEWEFCNNENDEATLSNFISFIEYYGYRYWEKMSDFDNLFEAVYHRHPGLFNERRERLLPILYYMRGKKKEGMAFISDVLNKRSTRPTDEELLRGRDKDKTIILRCGEVLGMTAKKLVDMFKSLPDGGSIDIVGAGNNGEVDPSYMEFVKKYMELE